MLARSHWWKILLAVFVMGGAAVMFMGVQTYQGAPPIPDFVAPDGTVLATPDDILAGQAVFQKYALMQYGTMFGDGGSRGPDFTAEALHQTAVAMHAHYGEGDATDARVKREIKENRYDAETKAVRLSEGQAHAFGVVVDYYRRKFTEPGPEAFKPTGYISDPAELKNLAAFFFWGAWVCGAQRPGAEASYTQNWPYDPLAGNTVTPGSIFWSIIGSLSLMLALGATLYAYGHSLLRAAAGSNETQEPVATSDAVGALSPTPTQRATYKFFAVAAALFLVQILAGVLTVHDFVGFTTFFGRDISKDLPLPITRSWHVQLSVLWISTCWIAGSIFVLPRISKQEPKGQVGLINLLFWMLVTVVVGMLVGVFLGPRGMLGSWWRALGNQGWEFVELGKVWQGVLFASLILWAVIVFRGIKPALRNFKPFDLPNWILYSVCAIVVLFLSSFVAQPTTNFVVADFWRWMVIHMWAECFFEVFTTVIIAFFMVLMGLVSREAASRVVFWATMLFCGSGFVGISHNFYWNAKPEATLALGAVFSTMQVVPLILLTVEAWRYRSLPGNAMRRDGAGATATFGLSEAFMFLLAVNFWNFVGAGAFGFIINLPIVNYYEHGTYLTVNHGHAALMGVYGNLSITAILFCARYLVRPDRWNGPLLRMSFWSLQIGLLLMILMDLFPAGIQQIQATLEHGLWYGRSQAVIQSQTFQTLTWMRIVGGAIFTLGGVIPLVWFMATRFRDLRAATPLPAPEAAEAPAPGPGIVTAGAKLP